MQSTRHYPGDALQIGHGRFSHVARVTRGDDTHPNVEVTCQCGTRLTFPQGANYPHVDARPWLNDPAWVAARDQAEREDAADRVAGRGAWAGWPTSA